MIITPIQPAEFPATPSAVQFLDKAVPRARSRVSLDGSAPIVPPQPNGFQMSLAPVRRFPEACGDHLVGGFKGAPAHTAPVGGIQRDRFVV